MQSIQLIIDMFVDLYKINYLLNFIIILITSGITYIVFWFGVKFAIPRLIFMLTNGKIFVLPSGKRMYKNSDGLYYYQKNDSDEKPSSYISPSESRRRKSMGLDDEDD